MGNKRPAADQERFEFVEARFNYARGSPLVVYRDTYGKLHTMHKAPMRSDDPGNAFELERDAVAWLHALCMENHVGEACGDAEARTRWSRTRERLVSAAGPLGQDSLTAASTSLLAWSACMHAVTHANALII